MIVYQKQIEYIKKSTSERVFNELLAKNLSERFRFLENDKKKLLAKDVEQRLSKPYDSKSVEDISKCQVLDCKKNSTVTVAPLRNESQMTDETFSSQSSSFNKHNHNELVSSKSHWNESHKKKQIPTLKGQMAKNLQITNIKNLLSITDVSGLRIITKTTLNSHQNIINRSTITLPNFVRIKKHRRKFKRSTSKNALHINSLGSVNKKTHYFRENVAVHENFNSLQQSVEPGRIFNLLKKEENPKFLIENFLINLPISRNELSIIASVLPPLCSEYNRNINPILNSNNRNSDCENEMINLEWIEKIFLFNPSAVNFFKKKLTKKCFNPSVFNSHPTEKETRVNLKYFSNINTQDDIEYSMVTDSSLQNEKNSYFREACSTSSNSAEASECLSKSFNIIDLWGQNRPSLQSFITKKQFCRKKSAPSTNNRFKDCKLKRKAVVILEHSPLIEKMVKSGERCSYCEFLNLTNKLKRKNKILLPHKRNNRIQKFRKKKELCDNIKNINKIHGGKYPIVLLPRLDISLFKNETLINEPERITKEEHFLNHSCSNKCKCFQSNPVVILIKLDALLMFDESLQNSVKLKSDDIIDLTDM